MKKSLKNDQLKEPMFFGQNVNVARYDQQKYETFEKLIEKQLSFFWRPQEVEVSSYLVGQIDSKVDTKDFDDFDL